MSDENLSRQFKALYEDWDNAGNEGRYDWMLRYLADDFLGTAQPWPTLALTKPKLLEASKAVATMEVSWGEVTAERFGDMVLTTGVRVYEREEFNEGATFGGGMPTGNQLAELVNGKNVLYTGAWRRTNGVWQLFDHHLVGIIEKGDQ
jgi:hypothetical protein